MDFFLSTRKRTCGSGFRFPVRPAKWAPFVCHLAAKPHVRSRRPDADIGGHKAAVKRTRRRRSAIGDQVDLRRGRGLGEAVNGDHVVIGCIFDLVATLLSFSCIYSLVMDAMAKVDSGRKHRGEKRRKNSRSKVIGLVGSRRMTEKNYHGDKCAEKDDHSFGIREEKAEDGRESADYKQKRVMDINRVTDKNHKSRNKDLEAEYRFDCEDEEVQKQDKSRRRTEEMDHPDSKYTEKDGEEGHKKVDSKQKRKADLNKENNRKRRKKDMELAYDCDIEAKEDQKEKKSRNSLTFKLLVSFQHSKCVKILSFSRSKALLEMSLPSNHLSMHPY